MSKDTTPEGTRCGAFNVCSLDLVRQLSAVPIFG